MEYGKCVDLLPTILDSECSRMATAAVAVAEVAVVVIAVAVVADLGLGIGIDLGGGVGGYVGCWSVPDAVVVGDVVVGGGAW